MSHGKLAQVKGRHGGRCAALLAALVLGGCEPAAQREPDPRDQALKNAIEAPQQRARAVEADVLEAKRRTDEAVEEQSD